MIRIVLLGVMCANLDAQPETRVTYLASQASVQDVVRTLAAQAGLGYDWQKSFDQTDPRCRRWVKDVRIEGVPFPAAMEQILGPVGLLWEFEVGRVVLRRAPVVARRITYSTEKKSVQYVVMDLAESKNRSRRRIRIAAVS